MKKILIKLLLLVAIVFISGCFSVTRDLYRDKGYYESVSSILMTQDGKQLIVISEKYHYIFDMPKNLPRILNASFRNQIKAEMNTFRVTGLGQTTGNFRLILIAPSDTQEKEALERGMSKACCVTNGSIYADFDLTGRRYSSGGVVASSSEQKLNQTYRITVIEDAISAKVLLLTPVTVLFDGVLAIATLPLLATPAGPFFIMK